MLDFNLLEEVIDELLRANPFKIIISNNKKNRDIKKIHIEKRKTAYQEISFTRDKVFHKNIEEGMIGEICKKELKGGFSQINAWSLSREIEIKISKSGKIFKKYRISENKELKEKISENNRKKNYILDEGRNIPPLYDMGIFTKDGKIVNSKYDKFRQINRFIEIIDDEIKKQIKKVSI